MEKHSRRAFVSTMGLTMVAGCVSSGDEPSNETNSSQGSNNSEPEVDTPERCHLKNREQQGSGESISEAIDLIETDDPSQDVFNETVKTENTNNLEEDSAWAAAEIAFRELAAEFGIEKAGDPPSWLFPAIYNSGERVSSQVIVQAMEDSSTNENNSYSYCPPSEYEFTRAIETAPSTVTVTLQSPDGSELHQQEHEIYIKQETAYLD